MAEQKFQNFNRNRNSIELENLNLILMVVPVRCPFDNESKDTIDLLILLLSLFMMDILHLH